MQGREEDCKNLAIVAICQPPARGGMFMRRDHSAMTPEVRLVCCDWSETVTR